MDTKDKCMLRKLVCVIIFDILAIAAITFMLYTVVYKHNQPTFMGYSLATVKSESMLPMLEVDDVVITKKQDYYKRGDIVIYKVWKIHVVHRIIHSYEEDGEIKYVTKGDNNDLRDRKKSTNENIVGKVIYIIPGFGTVIKVISYTTIVAIISFMIGFVYDMRKDKRDKRRKKRRGIEDVQDREVQ